MSTRFPQQEVRCEGKVKFAAIGQETSRLLWTLDLSNVFFLLLLKVSKNDRIIVRSTYQVLSSYTSQKVDKRAAEHHRCVGIGIDVETCIANHVRDQHALVEFGQKLRRQINQYPAVKNTGNEIILQVLKLIVFTLSVGKLAKL